MVSELYNWYKGFDFPHYQPEYSDKLKKTVADSYLCADSVGKFMTAMNVEYKDPLRKGRCAGVTADTTRYLVEMLNRHFAL